MVDIETLFKIAETLKKRDEFFGSFEQTAAIVGLLRTKGCCVYCGVDLFATPAALAGGIHTDHLLPKSKPEYKHLLSDPLNLVPSCPICNSQSLKSDWDPNTENPRVYQPESKQPLSEEQYCELVRRVKKYIAQKRDEKERKFAETSARWRDALEKIRIGLMAGAALDDTSKIAPGRSHKG